MSFGKLYLSSVLAKGSVTELLQGGPMDHLFKASEEPTFHFVREFVKKHHALPTPETVAKHTQDDLPVAPEPPSYYLELLQTRHTELALKKTMKDASDFLSADNKHPQKALEVMVKGVMELVTQRSAKQIVDFRMAHDAIFAEYATKFKGQDEYGFRFGWPTLDEMTGGVGKKDLVSFVGRPGAGKTWMMLYVALQGWLKSAQNPNTEHPQSRLFVSMEVGSLPIQQRLASILASIPFGQLKDAKLSTVKLQKLKKELVAIQGFGDPFYVVDGNLTSTVEDIWMIARQLGVDGILVDGGYLVKHPTEKDRFRRVAENAELMKSELAPIAPTTVSWQFAKTAAKKNKKPGETPDLEDIGYTDAIAQVSSIVLALLQEESVETLKSRKIHILKGRNGEVGEFTTAWEFDKMQFGEIDQVPVEELVVV